MYTNILFLCIIINFFFSFLCILLIVFSLVALKGGCPSPRACGAYPPTSPAYISCKFYKASHVSYIYRQIDRQIEEAHHPYPCAFRNYCIFFSKKKYLSCLLFNLQCRLRAFALETLNRIFGKFIAINPQNTPTPASSNFKHELHFLQQLAQEVERLFIHKSKINQPILYNIFSLFSLWVSLSLSLNTSRHNQFGANCLSFSLDFARW